MTPQEARELSDALNRFSDRADRLLGPPQQSPASNNRASIEVNAGGVGVWVAATCCVVMLACNVFLAAQVMTNAREISDLNDYLSAIYMQAPYLKPQPHEGGSK